MRQSVNNVNIRGKVIDIDLKEAVNTKTNVPYISGKIVMQVPQAVEGIGEVEEIEVSVYSSQKTKAGEKSKVYDSIKELKNKAVSITQTSETAASTYDITGTLDETIFPDRNGEDVYRVQVRGSFFNKTNPRMANDAFARFTQEIVITRMDDEIVNDELTGRLVLKGMCMNYNGPALFTYHVENHDSVEFIKMNWSEGQTVMVQGLIRCTSVAPTPRATMSSGGFGSMVENNVYEKTVREYIITAGSDPYDMDSAFDLEEVTKSRKERLMKYEEDKANRKNRSTSQVSDAGFGNGFGAARQRGF